MNEDECPICGKKLTVETHCVDRVFWHVWIEHANDDGEFNCCCGRKFFNVFDFTDHVHRDGGVWKHWLKCGLGLETPA